MPTNIKLMFNIVAKGEERNRLVSALEKLGGHKSSHFPEFIEMDSTGTLQNPRITTVDIYFGIELSLLDTYGIYFDENQILHGDSCIGYVTEKGIQIASNLDNYFLYYDLFRRKGNLKILPASASAASAASA
jgi:hypothetical protein